MTSIKRAATVVLALLLLGAAGFLIFAPGYVERSMNVVQPHNSGTAGTKAEDLHASLTIGDWHADSLLWKRDLTRQANRGHVDLPRLIEGNVALQVFTAVTKSPRGLNFQSNAADAPDDITLLAVGQLWPPRTWQNLTERALYQAEKLARAAEDSDGTLRIIRSQKDLDQLLQDRLAGQSVVGAIFGIEGGHALEGDLANLDRLEDAGLRLFGLQHFFDNELGGSLHGQGGAGLTDFGKTVVSEIVRRGMILDLAHSSPEVARDVLEMTDIPLVVSHTGIRSHCDTVRNFPDDLMRAIAQTGGTIGIGYWASVTCDDSPAGIAGAIGAAIAVVGEDHVSLGSDFDGTVTTSFDTAGLSALTQAMLDAGLSEGQIRKVAGENMLRVLRARLP